MKNRLLFDKLAVNGFVNETHINKVDLLSLIQLENLIESLVNVIEIDEKRATSNFELVSNSYSSAEPNICSKHRCRISKAIELAHIASLYSDKIWVKSPFEKYKSYYIEEKNSFHHFFKGDLKVLFFLRPLIENGIIAFMKPRGHLCRNCMIKSLPTLSDDFKNRLGNVEEFLINQLKKNFKIELKRINGVYKFRVNSTDKNLLGHGHDRLITLAKIDDPKIQAFIERKKINIEFEEAQALDLINPFQVPIIDDLIQQSYLSASLDANYLSTRELDNQIIDKINTEGTNKKSNTLMNSFVQALPMLYGITTEDLIRLRSNEGESFKVFRDSINNELFQNNLGTQKEIIDFVRDRLEPEINRISNILNKEERRLKSDVFLKLILTSAAFTIGKCDNLIGSDIAQGISTLGGFHHGSGAIMDIKNYLTKDIIKEDKYYFLWKMKNIST